jgi:hypothetical protein
MTLQEKQGPLYTPTPTKFSEKLTNDVRNNRDIHTFLETINDKLFD